MELHFILYFEFVLVLRQKGQANFVRHPLEGIHVDALVGCQAAHTLLREVYLNFVFDFLNLILCQEIGVFFLEFVKFSFV